MMTERDVSTGHLDNSGGIPMSTFTSEVMETATDTRGGNDDDNCASLALADENDTIAANNGPAGSAYLPIELVRERDEAREQASALLEAIGLLSRLAAMDPACACQRRRLGSRDGGSIRANKMATGEANEGQQKAFASTGKKRPRWRSDDRIEENDENAEALEDYSAKEVVEEKMNAAEVQALGTVGSEEEDAESVVSGANAGVDDSLMIEGKIDALQTQWALEQTAIPALLACIQRLQSNLAAVQAESDSATAEMHALHRSLANSRQREQRLERAVKKLYKQNNTLRERLAKKKRDRKSFVRNVKEAVSGMKMMKRKEEEVELEERQVATRLMVHETVLRMGSMSSKSKVEEVGGATIAAAISANVTEENDDSASSFTKIEHPVTDDSKTCSHSHDKDDHDFESGSIGCRSTLSSLLDADALSVASISESSASTTSVDDSGVATVRLKPSASFPPPIRGSEDGKDIGDSITIRGSAGDDGINWGSVRSKMGLGDTISSSSAGASIRPMSSLFLSTSSAGQPLEHERVKVGGVEKIRDRAASADDVLSWSSVRATFGVSSSSRASAASGSDSSQRDKPPTPSSSMGQRLMAQLSGSAQFPAASQQPPHIYTLTFPTGKKIGLQFQKVQCESDKTKNEAREETINFRHGQEFDGTPNVSPFREAAADLSADLKAIGVRIDSLLLGPAGSSSDSADIGNKAAEPFSLGSGGGAPGEAVADDDDILPEFAFLVSGYHGFNDSLNVRPTIGSRLVAIDGESLERGRWTFRRLRAVIEARANSSSPGGTSTFTMSFRNEPLTSAQQEVLDNTVSKSEEQQKPPMGPTCLDGNTQTLASSAAPGNEAKADDCKPTEKDKKPPLAPSSGLERPSLAEEKRESFLKKLSLKRKDSKDVSDAEASGNQRKETDGKGDAPPPPSTASAHSLLESKEVTVTAAGPEKGDSLTSAEEFKSTMKAVSKKFKSLF